MPKKDTYDEAKSKAHKFWDSQPVPKLTDTDDDIKTVGFGNIEGDRTIDDVQKEPYALSPGYEWFTVDVHDEEMLDSVFELLADHYVEDDDGMFRFQYSKAFLRWALTPPGYSKDWHVGVRVSSTKKIVAFISGVLVTISVKGEVMKMAEINFLCVHKKIRAKRLSPMLIKEVTRRVNLQGVWQAVYTAGIVLPRPISRCQYYHRSLNPQKLIAIGFSRIPPSLEKFQRPMEAMKKYYQLPDVPQIAGLRAMKEEDVPKVTLLLNKYVDQFDLHQVYSEEEVAHIFIPIKDVINTYVVEVNGIVSDMVSFYTLPSSIIGNSKYSVLKAAYSFYNVANTVSWDKLMTDALIHAKAEEFDVFNCLDVMENTKFLAGLKFGVGDGHLQYYLYNWRFTETTSSQIGLVLV